MAFDLDGTLLNRNRRLSEGNRAALIRAQEAGWTVVLASGRSISSMRAVAEAVRLNGPIVSCNGAFVESADGQVVHSMELAEEAVRQAVALAQRLGLHCNAYRRAEIAMSSDQPYGSAYRRITGLPEIPAVGYEALGQGPATKVVFMGQESEIDRAEEALRAEGLQVHGEIIRSEGQYVEVVPQKVNKAFGLQAAAASVGMEMSEVAAIGDYLNDLEMVQSAGFGAAVGNAHADVKAVAKRVFADHDKDGAAELVNFLLQQT
jgi:Cof subfamily protein (haloacid dehalogenase superfamily)